MHKLFFDTETGGINYRIHSLLTAFFAVCDENLNVIDELYLQLKPSDLSLINVTEEAMNINGINLEDHLKDPNTITYEEGRVKLMLFLQKHKIKKKRKSYQPCGHNVSFDKDFIWEWLMPQEEFESIVHYRTIDTSNICSFLKDVDVFPQDVGSLTSLVDYFKITMRDAHNARGDVLMNIDVYKKIKSMIVDIFKQKIGSITNNSLLSIIEG